MMTTSDFQRVSCLQFTICCLFNLIANAEESKSKKRTKTKDTSLDDADDSFSAAKEEKRRSSKRER